MRSSIHAWPLVELFSTIRREHPDDGNRAAQHIVERLRALFVFITVHEPQLYLTLPKGAHVEADGRRMFARPARMTRPAPQGVDAPLAFVSEADQPAGRLGAGERGGVRRRLRSRAWHA